MPASTNVDLEALLVEVRTSLKLISGTPDVVIRAMLPADAAYPQSDEHLILDVVPTTPTNTLDSTVYADLAIQVGAWSSATLTAALALAEAARARMVALGYGMTGGAQLITEDAYHGVVCTYTLVGAYGALT